MRIAALAFSALLGCGTDLGQYGWVEWTDRHGIGVAPNGYPVERTEFEAVVDDTIARWGPFVLPGIPEAAIGDSFASWSPLPFGSDYGCPDPRGCAGVTIGGRIAVVGFDTPISGTALAHEIGHVILFRAGLPAGEHHAWMAERGLL